MIDRIEAALGQRVTNHAHAAGGCIGDSSLLTLEDGRKIFAKQLTRCPQALLCEATGLKELARAEAMRVPKVLYVEAGLLILEAIRPGHARPGDWETAGRQFAQLHRTRATTFGFTEDNWIGATPQTNETTDSWTEFYWTQRLLPQLQLAETTGYADSALRSAMAKLEQQLPRLLAGTEELPSLLHGDLWSGNLLWDDQHRPVLIDPAVSYGHREADLAMTHLFGGFPPEFYAAYEEDYPLPAGHRDRIPLYELYHVLNHLNLFGGSYYGGAMQRLRILGVG